MCVCQAGALWERTANGCRATEGKTCCWRAVAATSSQRGCPFQIGLWCFVLLLVRTSLPLLLLDCYDSLTSVMYSTITDFPFPKRKETSSEVKERQSEHGRQNGYSATMQSDARMSNLWLKYLPRKKKHASLFTDTLEQRSSGMRSDVHILEPSLMVHRTSKRAMDERAAGNGVWLNLYRFLENLFQFMCPFFCSTQRHSPLFGMVRHVHRMWMAIF